MRQIPSRTATGVDGAAAGAAATVVMTAVLEAGRRMSLFDTPPPVRIVRRLLAGSSERPLAREMLLAGLAHLGYGGACGALFALLARRRSAPGPGPGVGFGLLLWLAGYGVWVPAIGAVPPLHRDRPGRQLALVAAHVVYGAVLAEGLRALRSGRECAGAAALRS